MATGLLDDGTDPAYWPILEYDPTALDPESTEPHFVLDPDDWPLPQVSLHETPTSPPTLNISRSSTPPKEPSTPDGLGDHRAARSTDAFPASAEDLGPGVVVDGLEGHELLGGVQPDEPVHQQVDGKDGVVTQEMAQETAAKPEPNGWAQADQVDATLVADAGQAGGDEKAQEAEDEEESVRSGKKAKSRKKKKKKPEEKPATRKGNDEEDLSLIREAQEARTADIVKIDEKLRRVHMEKLEQLVMDWFMVDIYMWVVQIDPEEPLPKTVQQLPLEELLTEIDIRLNDRDRFLAVWFAHPNWQPGSVQTFVSHGILPTHPEKLDEDIPPGYEEARLAEKRKLEEEHNLNSQRRLREMHGQQAGASSNRAARSQSPTTSRDRGPVHDPGKARELRRFMRSMPGLTLINVGGGYEGVGDGDEHEDPLEAILKDMQADHEAGADPLWGPTPMRWRGGDRQRSSELLKDAESLREEHLGEVTIPGLEQMRDLPLALQRPNPARAAMEAAELLDIAHMYFDPHKNRKLPTWLYTPHSHTLARSLHSIPTLDQFSRMNPERRLNVMIKMTDLMSENPKPNLVMEGQRLKGFCNRSPQLVPAQKLIYSEIMKRLRDAKPYWDRAMKSLETFKAFQANDSSLAQPQMLEVPGSNPLKLQPRQKTAKPEKGKRR
ncbi:hypothetical protein WJX84_010199 [Apatococcus fuscideae]|uniref:Uncharacterized protein n=1 Tax=Apatococcus fuscideae TaxID=2026836 RepID=A0AAW1SAM5_9CHLO